jgi:hypothetical protein
VRLRHQTVKRPCKRGFSVETRNSYRHQSIDSSQRLAPSNWGALRIGGGTGGGRSVPSREPGFCMRACRWVPSREPLYLYACVLCVDVPVPPNSNPARGTAWL